MVPTASGKHYRNPLIYFYLDLIGLHAPEPNPMLFERVKCSFYLNWHLCNEPERFSILCSWSTTPIRLTGRA
ncbi:MAG: hypothetical protein H6559_33135 [Lewinellaceae bacterium]|nr:hypothetical protein [Lewinellaceae bacterium]